MTHNLVATEIIKSKIYNIREQRVILDRDLSTLYQVETRYLNKAVKRNADRFPENYVFQLTKDEFEHLKFQIGTSSWGGTRKPPFAFTEHGTLMASSILKSSIAIQINQKIINAFVELRHQLSTSPQYELLLEKIRHIESRQEVLALNQKIDTSSVSKKVQTLSQDVFKMSHLLDEFQDAHLIIKRPNEGKIDG